ncbi:MAG: UrcA family protein [Alphaproteobacteria bacterium]|nr:UrcA family protein [Alphaproteobacteria bacterium]MBU1516843.1 UrcA family protein [Alphaproteobacteria bacterium]MBU2092537.1 UrcA family protein [Alphaproteobacteria bacterium]MBU2151351.1 UrcA family protein [Alphaproteobacteria bacterium]MBU2309654.1 UrcA family protein [Alphaproteobacteria bacterium]
MKLLALAAVAALTLAAPAMAAPVVTTSIAVSPAGLDLSSAAGASTMAGRIDRAAVSACGASSFSARDVQVEVRRSACYRAAVGGAETALNAPAVSAALRATPFSGS